MLGWTPHLQWLKIFDRPKVDGMKLGLVITKSNDTEEFQVLAIETLGDTSQAVLGSHAHKLVGRTTYKRESNAFKSAERYAAKWLKQPPSEKCDCEEIVLKKSKRKTKKR